VRLDASAIDHRIDVRASVEIGHTRHASAARQVTRA
jgi:hypothetical protein